MIVYNKINSATFSDKDALTNLLVFWINVPKKIATPRSVTVGGALYIKIVNSSFIISIIPLIRPFSFFIAAKICFNNTTILTV